jgi:trehalose 6-phosphate synthase
MNRLVVVSNRVPTPGSGNQAGGLAVALAGLMGQRGGVWFGWSGEVSNDHAVKSHVEGSVQYATIDLTKTEHERYYNEFSNSTLWPLLHSMPELMRFDRRNALAYRAVNERMATALVPLLRPNDILWVHDYHLMAMPALLRKKGVVAPIGFFLHIPFPSADMLASVPEAGALIHDLLSSDLIGFQTQNDVENFAEAAHRLAGATRLTGGWLHVDGRRVRLGAFPVEIEAREFAATAEQACQAAPTERLRRSLQGQKLVLGVDRLDPTKGLIQRLAGYRRLLETRPDWRRRVTMLQIAAESRKDVSAYRELRNEMDRAGGAINSEWSEPDWTPLRIVARAGARATMGGYMREARVGLVTPLRDGMNLVAKEYIAAQDPQDPGVLVLSRFAGAARQLSAALLVNPHDADELADALDRGLRMSLSERQERWQACWRAIDGTTPAQWGRNFLATLLRVGSGAPANTVSAPKLPAQAIGDAQPAWQRSGMPA